MNQIPLYCNIYIQGVELLHYKLQPVMFFQFSCASFSNHPKKDLAREWVFRPCYNTWHNTEETDQEWWLSGFTKITDITVKKQIKSDRNIQDSNTLTRSIIQYECQLRWAQISGWWVKHIFTLKSPQVSWAMQAMRVKQGALNLQ